jgi:hypothetical protein
MRSTMFVLALSLFSLLASASARADEATPELHLAAGVEVEGSTGITSTGFRGQALIGTHLGSGRFRPSIAAGVVLGKGVLYVTDPRAARGSVGVDYSSIGPAMQLGLQLCGHDGHEAAFVFAGAAHLWTSSDERLMLDAVPGVTSGTGQGMRAALGINWAHGVAHLVADAASGSTKSPGAAAVLLFFLPQQLELTVERDTGSTRAGGTFSWGF